MSTPKEDHEPTSNRYGGDGAHIVSDEEMRNRQHLHLLGLREEQETTKRATSKFQHQQDFLLLLIVIAALIIAAGAIHSLLQP